MPNVSTFRLRGPRPTWVDQGACGGSDPELFFPTRGEDTKQAKAVCAACPVREPCLEYALANGEHYGIWGGWSERERRRDRRKRDAAARAAAA